ncbi:MAG TPA: lysophospholipid acyltransferase family protein [Candidatus Saccharimonadales bacterium]|nr:lysophospholipid acyltransferase family protein [Candidatus Saccharimonadales bacterium]
MTLWVKLCRFLARPILFLVGPLRVRGEVSRSGAFLLVCNHLSEADPPVLQVACERHIRFMAKTALFRVPLLGWYLRSIGCFPVNQSEADLSAIRRAIELLKQGEVVGIFPEGKVNRTDEPLLPLTKGAAFIAHQARVPIVVCAVRGTNKVWPKASPLPRRKHQIAVDFGPTLWFPSSSNEDVTEAIDRELRKLV